MFEELLTRINTFARDSYNTRSSYERLWAENLLLMQGQFSSYSAGESTVRRRNSSFYRLGYAARQEVLAALHTAYLKDEKTATIIAQNETEFAATQSAVYGMLFETHIQYLRRYSSLLVNHLRAVGNAIDYGFCCGRFIHRPNVGPPYNIVFEVFPPDEVLLDWGANEDSSKFAIIQHWYTAEELQAMARAHGFENLDALAPTSRSNTLLRDIRMGRSGPTSQTVPSTSQGLYAVWECYLWLMLPNDEAPRPYLIFTDENARTPLTSPLPLPLKRFPLVVGQLMLNPGIICGVSLAEVVRDPQETFNELMNSRLDNLALVLRPVRLVSADVGIDKHGLARAGAGDLIEVSPGPALNESIFTLETPDVTRGAAEEAQNAAFLIRSLAGLPDQTLGTSGTPEGVVSQVYQAAAKKIDLIIGTFAQTYWRPWHETLLDLVAAYDDDNAVAVAMQCVATLRPSQVPPPQMRVGIDVNLGVVLAHAARQLPSDLEVFINLVQQAALVNQQTLGLVQSGIQARETATLFDTAKLLSFAMDRAGVRGVRDFLLPIPMPPAQAPPQVVQGKQATEQTQVVEGGQVIRNIQKVKTQFPVTQQIPVNQGQPPEGGAPSTGIG